MCENCFNVEYKRFENEKLNSEVSLKISQLLSERKLFLLEEKSALNIYENYNIYQCKFCNQIWCYSYADLYWRGFLLRQENLGPHLTKIKNSDKQKKRNGIIIFGIAIIITTLFLLLRN